MPYTLEKIDKKNSSDEYWQRIYQHLKKSADLANTIFKEQKISSFKSSFIDWLNNGAVSYLVWKDQKTAGSFALDVFRKESPHDKKIAFHNRLVDAGIEQELIKLIFEAYLQYDAQSQYFFVKSENGDNDSIPLKLAIDIHDHRGLFDLQISSLSKEYLIGEMDYYFRKFPELSLDFHEILPEELYKSYCDLFVGLVREIPGNPEGNTYNLSQTQLRNREAEMIKFQQYELRYLLRDKNKKLIGLTSLGFNKKNPEIGHQHLTGISIDYRGRGLAKYLKVAMLLKILNSYPEVKKLETEIHTANKISIKMNKSMAFKQKGYRKVYLISRERIKTWLNNY